MPAYTFTLILAGSSASTDEHRDALDRAGCGDATWSKSSGFQEATFHREAPTYLEALRSVNRCLQEAVPGLRLARVREKPGDDALGRHSQRRMRPQGFLRTCPAGKIRCDEAKTSVGSFQDDT